MKLDYILRLADDALIAGHRLSEWTGHGPILEQDIALTNTALDHIGRARSLYQYAAETFNNLPTMEKSAAFSSVALNNMIASGNAVDEDDLAYLRDVIDFRNVLLLEQPNGDWAYTIAKSFYHDAYNYLLFEALQHSSDPMLAAVAAKSLKEATYHLRWSSEWVIRLGDGTEESHEKMQHAINELWMYTGELFIASESEKAMAASGEGVDLGQLASLWMSRVSDVLTEATLTIPTGSWMQQGGKKGIHSEHLGYILAEMQFMQRAYPGMEW
jgi:ring-1,2-phenylacetyl-CoA epoxidase subunit PaaC